MPSNETPFVPSAEPMHVPADQRRSWASVAIARAGGSFAAPVLMVGAGMAMGMGFAQSLWAALFGYGFVVLYMCFIGMQSADLGLPTASLAAGALGRRGARYLVSILVGVVTVGWFGVQTAVCAASLSVMLHDVFAFDLPVWVASIALGALMLATAVVGFDGLKVLGTVAAPLLVCVCLYGVYASVSDAGSASAIFDYLPASSDAIGFVAGAGMAVGLFAFGGATAADVTRFCRNRRDAVLSSIVGVLPTSMVAIATGGALALVTGESDIAILLNSAGLPILAIITLVLSAWAVNAGNVFSAGANFSVLLGRTEGSGSKAITAVAGIAGTALAVVGILDAFSTFLSVLSACGPALAGVLIADYWIVRRADPARMGAAEGVSGAGLAAFLAGLAVGMATGGTFAGIPVLSAFDLPFFIGPVNGLVTAMAVYVAVRAVQDRAGKGTNRS